MKTIINKKAYPAKSNALATANNKSVYDTIKNQLTTKDITLIGLAVLFFCTTLFFSIKTGGDTTKEHTAHVALNQNSKV